VNLPNRSGKRGGWQVLDPEPPPLRIDPNGWGGNPTYEGLNFEADICEKILKGRPLTGEEEDRFLFGFPRRR
jgi:hypothetical protein